jgi:hypothetical protein
VLLASFSTRAVIELSCRMMCAISADELSSRSDDIAISCAVCARIGISFSLMRWVHWDRLVMTGYARKYGLVDECA